MSFIPVSEPFFYGKEKEYLLECIDTGWISSEGPFVKRLETGIAQRCRRRHGIATCNGTAALELAVAALRLGPGDEVILPSLTIISCALAVVKAGAIPVVVDCDPVTWNMDPEAVRAAVTNHTRAIMAVHTYGMPCPMDPLLGIAREHRLWIIEDAAEAIGLTYRGRPCGSFGDISIMSFFSNKHITTGEGGMLLTDDDTLAERCRYLRNLCFIPGKKFEHEHLGFNFRMSNLQAAVGVAQLEKLDDTLAAKQRIGSRYNELLVHIDVLQRPMVQTNDARNCYWVYGLVLGADAPATAEEVMRQLHAAGIGTRAFFWPMHEQPVFRRMGLFQGMSLPVSERLARRGFYIPSGVGLTDDQLHRVAEALTRILT